MKDFTDDLKALHQRLDEAAGYLRVDELRSSRSQLETEASRPDLWDDPEKARQVNGELQSLVDDLEIYEDLDKELQYLEELAEIARELEDESQEPEIAAGIATLAKRFGTLELRSLFTGDYDDHDAVCEVNSGAGGTDAADWAEMLLRMYLRWAERQGFEVELD